MSLPRLSAGSRIFIGVLATVAVILFFGTSTNKAGSAVVTPNMDNRRGSADPIPNLDVSLSQTSTSPPTIQVTVTNKNTIPVTVMMYGSPLDPLALQLGLASITPAGADSPLELTTIQVRRQWPPPDEFFVTIEPEKSATNDLVIREPLVSMDALGSEVSVALKGKWEAVWAATKEAIDVPQRQDISSSGAFSGDFAIGSLDVTIG